MVIKFSIDELGTFPEECVDNKETNETWGVRSQGLRTQKERDFDCEAYWLNKWKEKAKKEEAAIYDDDDDDDDACPKTHQKVALLLCTVFWDIQILLALASKARILCSDSL